MAIVDDLLVHPGTYLGLDQERDASQPAAARMVVAPLPGGGGVTLDYEVFNTHTPERIRPHVEHTVIARTHDGGTIMVVAHPHGPTVAVLHETDPGVFELGPEGSPFPMKVLVSVPEPGRIRHSWWYGAPGEEPIERDVAEVTRSG
jgi:hypothetical protein